MKYNNNQEIFTSFDYLTQQVLVLVSILCREWGVSVRSFYETIKGIIDAPAFLIQREIHRLAVGKWILLSGKEVKGIEEVFAELEESEQSVNIINSCIVAVMQRLIEKTTTNTIDDLRPKKGYFLMAMAVLGYFQRKNSLTYGTLGDLYAVLAVNVSRNIGVPKVPVNVKIVYDLPIYSYLQYGLSHVYDFGPLATQIRVQMSHLLLNVFEYQESSKILEIARIGAIREGITDTQVDVFIAQSRLNEDQGLYAKALEYLWLAYITNKDLHGDNCEQNYPVILEISDICLLLEDKGSCKKWLNKLPLDIPTYSELNIRRLLIQAELYEEITISLHLCETAKNMTWEIFNFVQPNIYLSYSRIYLEHGMFEEGIEATAQYVKANQALYGYTTNEDINIYYTCKIIAELTTGSSFSAEVLTNHVIDFCPADSPVFSFLVRAHHWLSIAFTYAYITKQPLASTYANACLEEVAKNEPSKETIEHISSIFDSQIPYDVYNYTLIHLAYQVKIDVAIENMDLDLAEEMCHECLEKIKGIDACWIQSQLGQVLAKQGRTDEAVNIWRTAIANGGTDIVDLSADIAKYAYDSFLTQFAFEVMDEALTKPLSKYSSYLVFAEIYGRACQFDKRDELYDKAYEAALSPRQKARVLSARAQDQDFGAIENIEKAIVFTDPDPGSCYDEELARYYLLLAQEKQSLCQLDEAHQALEYAKEHAPTDCTDFFEEVDDII